MNRAEKINKNDTDKKWMREEPEMRWFCPKCSKVSDFCVTLNNHFFCPKCGAELNI